MHEKTRDNNNPGNNVVSGYLCVGVLLSFRACNANAIDLHKIFPAACTPADVPTSDDEERNSPLSDGRDFGGGCYGAFPVLQRWVPKGCSRLLFLASSPLFAVRPCPLTSALRASHSPVTLHSTGFQVRGLGILGCPLIIYHLSNDVET